ncbi:MAG: transglutaminase domain protein [Bacteroidetes bacterium]|nr:transglutaminase domain protein [Bacteroidota bacterium]
MLSGANIRAADSTLVAFRYVDSIATYPPVGLTNATDSIAAYLLRSCTTDMEKARAAFTWVAHHISYDDEAYNSGKHPDQSATNVLKIHRAVCEGYANLYKSLCEAMGLDAVKISGYAKGYSYNDGDHFSKTNHAWNAVKVDGRWILLDATWGSGVGDTEQGKMVSHKRFMPYWFDVDKKEFLFRHFPEDPQWLLIKEALTLEQYEDMPRIREPLFMMSFSASDILDKYLSKTLPNVLPRPFYSKHHVTLVDFPLTGVLAAGTQIDLTIISDEDLILAISNNLKEKPVMMKRSGNRYTASLTLKRGDLHIAIAKEARHYSDIMQYKVK